MKRRFIRGAEPTEKQSEWLKRILFTDNTANTAEETPATEKQVNYLRKLGYEGETDSLSKESASKFIDALLNDRR